MVNIDIFIKALKITCVRRILKSESSVPWITLVNTMIPNLYKFYDTGTRTIVESINGMNNPFWNDTLRAWVEFNQINTP